MKKTLYFSKIISLLMAILMLSSVIIMPASAAAAPKAPATITATPTTSSIKLTWSKVSGATGYRIYYKLPGDISWRTGLSSTASTTHTFKGLPEGQSYTFAVRSYTKSNGKITWGSYKQIATATKTAAPKKLTATQTTSAIKLTWSKVESAKGYRIYYKTSSADSWKVTVKSTDKTTHTLKNFPSGKKYIFAVRSYTKSAFGTFYGNYATIETATKPATPKVAATSNSSSITLKWNKISGADGYRVYYKTGSSGWKTAVSSTTATSKTFNTTKNYIFAVRAYINTASGTIWSGYKEVAVKKEPTTITVGTGGTSGTYYAFTGAVCSIIQPDNYRFNVISTSGSKANIEMIDEGSAQFAIVQNDVMNYAYKGERGFYEPITSFSAVACTYPEVCQLIATKNSGIKTLSDLKGKKVAIGAPGSGVYYNAIDILSAAGLTEANIIPWYQSFADSADALKDGKIDAAFIVAGIPTTAVFELSATSDILVVDFGKTVINKLIAKYPFYEEYVLSKDTYRQYINKSATTVAIRSTFIASNKLSEDVVYKITKNLWEKQPEIATAHAKGNEMQLSKAVSAIGNVPLHPGATKYYKEIGLIK